MRTTFALPIILSLCWCTVAACGDDGGNGGDTETADAAVKEDNASGSGETHEVTCTDESVATLTLFDAPNLEAEVRNIAESDGFTTDVDASGGGLAPMQSFVYMKFGDDGLTKVEISDEEAFESSDWDIAARRYVLRLNSGVSGPSSVTGARTRPQTKFDELDALPEELDFRTEQYFDETCTFVDDSSGLESPGTALASFWSYKSCVEMTHNVYIIEQVKPKKRHIKLEVLAYYFPDRQAICDETGMVPMPSGAGNLKLRWAFLD
jgi:hypothetical protein